MPFLHRVGFSSVRLARNGRVSMQRRLAHDERSMYDAFPFTYHNRRKAFAVKYVVFVGTGFSIPFIASWYQIRKSGGTAA
ncbi:hypothetical protein PUNSTDRAFT_55689 [Punctularia strigosozonata HHB-11173 SS5]|uniref:Cytochrome c oxidase subunit 8, mitochondrial n=1 Tax=Punctularia strigosozonata (strain HHB-11173) TaxID=741275 RepID=R7S1I4_PUNST|nr:uncharacterized protein PUNSTDRAFT_55689 [Punctularia strigosozonata HHB-11173 SS5]EIN04088.1 hypothetical protein PUNSTDRAFT_55689 [Punctularia strigosozonata HHB-11173 SS5]